MRLDFVKRIGGMGLELALGALLLGIVFAAWNATDSRAATAKARAARTAAAPVSPVKLELSPMAARRAPGCHIASKFPKGILC